VTFSQIVRLIGLWLVLASQQQIHRLRHEKEKSTTTGRTARGNEKQLEH
jgi:hypothetical protein